MFSNLCLCYVLSVTLLTIMGGERASCSEHEYDAKTTEKSLKKLNQQFVSIELLCDEHDTVLCEDFKCSVRSSSQDDEFWFFKSCPKYKCDLKPVWNIEGSSAMDKIQVSSDITFNRLESRMHSCTAEVPDQNIITMNNNERHLLDLVDDRYTYEIFRYLQEVRVIWLFVLNGNPQQLRLLPNSETIISPEKYEYEVFENNQGIFLRIKNYTIDDWDTTYFFSAKNEFETRTFSLGRLYFFSLEDKRITVHELTETYSIVNCTAAVYDRKPWCEIFWRLKKCSRCPYIDIPDSQFFITKEYMQCTSSLKIDSFTSGTVECIIAYDSHTDRFYQEIDNMKGSVDIFIEATDTNESPEQFEGENVKPLVLKCRASALNHTAHIQWAFKNLEDNIDDPEFVSETQNNVFMYQKTLELPRLRSYNGEYFCKTVLKNGTIEYKSIDVNMTEFGFQSPEFRSKCKRRRSVIRNRFGSLVRGSTTLARNQNWIYYAVALFLITVVAIAIFIGIKMRKNQILQKQVEELHLTELANFEKGALEHLNPNLTIDEQADLLPYDKRYEFPIERLQLGEQIGSGAFGVVIKGEATGILENEPNTTVAIKMVNRNIGDVYIKALASELKIMIHLGKHVNIVNLLGACTKNIIKRELLVISEYCRFGNLKDYLLHNRQSFVDQINTETGQIDWTIGEDVLEVNKPERTHITPCCSNSFYKGDTTSSTSKQIDTRSNCTQQSGDTLHHKGDYFNQPVCTRDLLLWSFQVARGMEYLSFRKVLHGDLAARNILLTDDNVVKICDFGLSKSMYQKDVYKKTGDEMLPVKWMAIEAITDKIFSVQSDVWSFGIVLWEIFSLARTPYPGMEYSEAFYERLREGYRMKSPQYATERIYEIMLHCWDADATERPSFNQLVQTIGIILEDKIRKNYIDMNSGYIKMNAQRFLVQNSDYMSMVSSPDIKRFSSPNPYCFKDY